MVDMRLIADFLVDEKHQDMRVAELQELSREFLTQWLITQSLNGCTLSWAEVYGIDSQHELDLAVDLLIACGIGRNAGQTQTVYGTISRA